MLMPSASFGVGHFNEMISLCWPRKNAYMWGFFLFFFLNIVLWISGFFLLPCTVRFRSVSWFQSKLFK